MAERYLGLISGTSADAVDAALVDFDPGPRVIQAATFPIDSRARAALLAADRRIHPADLLDLDAALGEAFADAAQALLVRCGVEPASVTAIGSHGQTFWHTAAGDRRATLQIGDPSRIVERTGITTVADFRRRDIAAGGQGAPLAPAFHAARFRTRDETRGVLNLGGIANLTVLPADPAAPVSGFDTGPASTLMDAWCRECLGRPYDRGGQWAASGRCNQELLAALLAEPYFRQPAPKSTGPEQFNLDWVERRGGDLSSLVPADVQATLLELTARTVAQAVGESGHALERLLICGGGVHNTTLVARIDAMLPGVVVESTEVHGVAPDYVEAVTFAWLARETLAGRAGNLPSVTGAAGPRVLGAIYPADLSWRAGA
ncbi:anhydro-N-acetylmuramic acid kinase [Ectothiorhodospiraceae bacterium WFHF3C12]|nr:anhydro-N-acetylmuramic acid kinase [Ectothiorhodospiraceae bacterium WFHF3C12]